MGESVVTDLIDPISVHLDIMIIDRVLVQKTGQTSLGRVLVDDIGSVLVRLATMQIDRALDRHAGVVVYVIDLVRTRRYSRSRRFRNDSLNRYDRQGVKLKLTLNAILSKIMIIISETKHMGIEIVRKLFHKYIIPE